MTTWVGQAYDELRKEENKVRARRYWEKTGCMCDVIGEEDHKVDIQGLPSFCLPVPPVPTHGADVQDVPLGRPPDADEQERIDEMLDAADEANTDVAPAGAPPVPPCAEAPTEAPPEAPEVAPNVAFAALIPGAWWVEPRHRKPRAGMRVLMRDAETGWVRAIVSCVYEGKAEKHGAKRRERLPGLPNCNLVQLGFVAGTLRCSWRRPSRLVV